MAVMEKKPTDCPIANCPDCQPHRICHWACAQCGGGPYRFAPTDPGGYKVLRPHYERTTQKYLAGADGVARWHYKTRRVCSAGCWQRESRRVQNDEMDLANKRPDLAPAIEAKLAAMPPADPNDFQDDLKDPGQF